MRKTFLQLYSNEYLDLLVESKPGVEFRDYLESKFRHKRKRFRCLAEAEDWMMLESINFLKKNNKQKKPEQLA